MPRSRFATTTIILSRNRKVVYAYRYQHTYALLRCGCAVLWRFLCRHIRFRRQFGTLYAFHIHFFHVNIIHYAANALALYKFDEFLALYFERRGCSRSAHYSVSACAVAAAVLASFFCTQPLPTIGLSGITFFYMGFVAAILHNRYTLIYIVVFALFNAIGLATGKMNVLLHAYTFVAGALYAAALLCNFTDKWHRLFKKS